MAIIKLTRGKIAIVDDGDFEYLNQFKWHLSTHGYAMRNSKMINRVKGKHISMHREIMGLADPAIHVDHINFNKLDNRKSNLRTCSNSENSKNRKVTGNGTSKFKGVYWYKANSKWHSRITVNYQSIHLGYFNNEKEAAKAYNKAAIKFHGEFAKLNCIDEFQIRREA